MTWLGGNGWKARSLEGNEVELFDFDVELGEGTGDDYPIAVLRSPAGEARAVTRFSFHAPTSATPLADLQDALSRDVGGSLMSGSPPSVSVQDFGQTLFDALFVGDVRGLWQRSLDRARQERRRLRLRLRCRSAELAALPWEFLYDASNGDYLCMSTQTPVVRYLELARPTSPMRVAPPLRVLAMTASPADLPRLDVDRERRRVEESTAGLRRDGLLELTWLQGGWRELHRQLRPGRPEWHVFHFIGHGGFEGHLADGVVAFVDEHGRAEFISATNLARLIGDHDSLRLVVLNSCEGARGDRLDVFSSSAATIVRRGIPAVLAMQFKISDRAAVELSRSFYESVVEGLPIDMALAEARKSVALALPGTLEWGTPVLYMRAREGVLFTIDADRSSSPTGKRELDAEASPNELVDRGLALQDEGDLDAAEQCYAAALESNDPEAAAWAALMMGQLFYERGDLDLARDAWERGWGLEVRTDADGHLALALGQLADEQDHPKRARRYYKAAITARDEAMTRAAISLGDLLALRGDLDEALEQYPIALSDDDTDIKAMAASRIDQITRVRDLIRRSITLDEEGDTEGAERCREESWSLVTTAVQS